MCSLYLGDQIISGQATLVGESRNIGQIIPSAIPLTDAGLHLLDGALIQGSGVYSAFVTYIAGLVSTYPNLFVTESAWQTAESTYGVCGKFVYDSVNNTVRLPHIYGFIEGTTDVSALGDLIEAGLPNITGTARTGIYWDGAKLSSGALNVTTNDGSGVEYDYGGDKFVLVDLDASRSSSIYGNSSTVQPQAIKAFYYIVIATSTKTDIQVDIDEVVTDLNGKADFDLSNINASQSAKNTIVGWGLPDYANAIDLGLSTTWKSYTCPSNGYVDFLIVGFTQGESGLKINNKNILITQTADGAYIQDATGQFMVSKGDVVSFRGTYPSNVDYGTQYIEFIPMKGAN